MKGKFNIVVFNTLMANAEKLRKQIKECETTIQCWNKYLNEALDEGRDGHAASIRETIFCWADTMADYEKELNDIICFVRENMAPEYEQYKAKGPDNEYKTAEEICWTEGKWRDWCNCSRCGHMSECSAARF